MERKKQRRDEELLQKIILRVKELRHMHNHQSQEQLAEKANISRSHLSAIEAPNMVRAFSMEAFLNIADALDVAPDELPESDDYFDYLQVLQYYPRRIFRPAPLPAERKINPSGASAAAIAGANPITGKQITEKQINSKQEPAATTGN